MKDLTQQQNEQRSKLQNRSTATGGTVRKWLELAKRAPSADNMQPWKTSFIISEAVVSIILEISDEVLAQAHELDANFSTSMIALGAYARNIEILALADGYELLRPVSEKNKKFNITLIPTKAVQTTLKPWIADRATNRLPYLKLPLNPMHAAIIGKLQQEMASKIIYTPKSQANKMISILGKLDVLRYTSKKLFFDFLSLLRFGSEVEKSKDGLASETLEVPLPARLMLALVRKFKFLWALNLLGAQYVSAWMGSTRLLNNSAGIITLQGTSDTAEGWFNLGFDLQTTWLNLNSIGISVQPFGTSLLMYRAHLEENSKLINLKRLFSDTKRKKLLQYSKNIETLMGLDLTQPHVVLRVGYANRAPTTQSLRK